MLRKLLLVLAMFTSAPAFAADISDALPAPYPAPEISGIKDWINSEPLKIADLKGKVVLVDFWAYSCVNCVRTLSHITEWDKKYRNKGLVIIGVHAPEFDFEKNTDNVKHAVTKWGITYPVALDNDQVTWNNYKNQYWPAHYLIDKQGNVVYTHFGEGNYDVAENNIRALLGLGAMKEGASTSDQQSDNQTPETYLGYSRAERFAGENLTNDGKAEYRYPQTALPLHSWSLSGMWTAAPQKITAGENGAALRLHFNARKVFLVMGTETGKSSDSLITLNGKPIGANGGKDVKDSRLTVDHHTLYEIVSQAKSTPGVLEITSNDAGLEAYAFTFGD